MTRQGLKRVKRMLTPIISTDRGVWRPMSYSKAVQVGGKALGEPVAESYAFVQYRPSVDEMPARPWLLHQLGRLVRPVAFSRPGRSSS